MKLANIGWAWTEITRDDHGHGGHGWEFGTCLWSPSRNRVAADRYGIMREPKPGDVVLHCLHRAWPDGTSESRFCGHSEVSASAQEVSNEPPSPGRWGGAGSYYRIPLSNFQAWPTPLPLRRLIEDYGNELLADLTQHSPKFYPFNRFGGWVRTVQGIYLARATPALIGLIRSALSIEADWAAAGQTSPGAAVGEWHREYAEGMRKQREAYFFARNPRLAADAKAHHGSCCQACGFDFASRYGALGAGYAECHHLSPLSERPENGWTVELRTKLEDVAVLCANCHRMVHRRRPALSLDELTATIRGGITPSQTAQHRIHLRPLHASKVVQKAQDEGVSDGVA